MAEYGKADLKEVVEKIGMIQTTPRRSRRFGPAELRTIFASPATGAPAKTATDTLRVRLIGKHDAQAAPGGGEIQMAATARALALLGDFEPKSSGRGNDVA